MFYDTVDSRHPAAEFTRISLSKVVVWTLEIFLFNYCKLQCSFSLRICESD